jgi:hypothetical protein
MEASLKSGRTARIAPAFIFLYFFNTFLLPQGLSFTLLLTPVWVYLMHLSGRLHWLKWLLAPALLYAAIHIWLGVDLFYYAVSISLLLCVCMCCMALWPMLSSGGIDYGQLFQSIVRLNFFFALLCLPLLFVPALKSLVWYSMAMTDNMRVIPRLRLFTYEASHYSYLLAPVVIFFYGKALFTGIAKVLPALFMVTVPLLMSLSFGVLACLLVSGLLVVSFRFNAVFDTAKKRLALLLFLCGLGALGLLLYKFFPGNLLYVRIREMLAGNDTSARGRTYESFIIAHKIIAQKSLLWGIGPGQLKLAGRDIVVQYYHYSKIPEAIRIPNACAETIVCFGYIGFALRIGAELLLFYATKVFASPYRLWLFLFLFIFQFTGSYITNATEYVFWMLAFSPALNFFQKKDFTATAKSLAASPHLNHAH